MTDIKILNWPEENFPFPDYGIMCKFVQLKAGDKRYIEFDKRREHGGILRNLLRGLGLPLSDEFWPPAKGDGYEVYGMGMAEIDHGRKTAHFFGGSSRYDVNGFDKTDIADLRKLKPTWSF